MPTRSNKAKRFFAALGDFAWGVLKRFYIWAPAIILDPMDWYNRFRPEGWPRQTIEPMWFWVALVFLLLWAAFLTYREVWDRIEPRRELIPLHEALWFIAQKSTWATRQLPENDDAWVSRVRGALVSALAMEEIHAWGVYGEVNGWQGTVPSLIGVDFWQRANPDWHNIVDANDPPHHAFARMASGSVFYTEIMLNKAELLATFPERGLLAKFQKRSPVERLGDYTKIQNGHSACYKEKNLKFMTPFEYVFGNE